MASFTAAKAALDEMVAPGDGIDVVDGQGLGGAAEELVGEIGQLHLRASPGVSVLSMPMTFVMVPSSSKATAMGTWLEYPFDCAMTA